MAAAAGAEVSAGGDEVRRFRAALQRLQGFDAPYEEGMPVDARDQFSEIEPSLLQSVIAALREVYRSGVAMAVNAEVEAIRYNTHQFRTLTLQAIVSELPGVQKLLGIHENVFTQWIHCTRERSHPVPDGDLREWAARFLPLLKTMRVLHEHGIVLGNIDESALVFVGSHLAFSLNLFSLDQRPTTVTTMETNVLQMRQEMKRRMNGDAIPPPPELSSFFTESAKPVTLEQLIYAVEHIEDWVSMWNRFDQDGYDATAHWRATLKPSDSPFPSERVLSSNMSQKLRSSGVQTLGELVTVARQPAVFHFMCTAVQMQQRGPSVIVDTSTLLSREEVETARTRIILWSEVQAGTFDPEHVL